MTETLADIVTRVASLPRKERVGLLEVLLRVDPDAAVLAVDHCRVLRPRGRDGYREPLGRGRGSMSTDDANLTYAGFALAGPNLTP